MGKLFTTILNTRINEFLESYGILVEEQASFRKTYGTNDRLFNLKRLADLFLFMKKKIFCAFTYYQKTFDSDDREALWHKLLRSSIDGNSFTLIRNMFAQAKSCNKFVTPIFHKWGWSASRQEFIANIIFPVLE